MEFTKKEIEALKKIAQEEIWNYETFRCDKQGKPYPSGGYSGWVKAMKGNTSINEKVTMEEQNEEDAMKMAEGFDLGVEYEKDRILKLIDLELSLLSSYAKTNVTSYSEGWSNGWISCLNKLRDNFLKKEKDL